IEAGISDALQEEAGRASDVGERPRVPHQHRVEQEASSVEDKADQEDDAVDEAGHPDADSARRVGELAINGTARADTVAEADDAFDLEFDEDKDFDTADDVRVPTDLVEAYKRDLDVEILNREQVIERSKDVEAGLTAGWILKVNEAVDSEDEDSLLTLRDEYIEARSENMMLGKKDDEEGDDAEPT